MISILNRVVLVRFSSSTLSIPQSEIRNPQSEIALRQMAAGAFSRPVSSGWKPVPTSGNEPTRPWISARPWVGSVMHTMEKR
jgi:hypothetical protein